MHRDIAATSRRMLFDFHMSPDLRPLAADFDEARFVAALRQANVNAVTLPAKCHHGYSYFDTGVGERHPGLSFDLLRRQYDACQAAGIAVTIYLSAGWDQRLALMHPGWAEVPPTEGMTPAPRSTGFPDPKWILMCFASPYLDHLVAHIEEVAALFPEADGFLLDTIRQGECVNAHARAAMDMAGLDWTRAEDRQAFAAIKQGWYLERATAAAKSTNAAARVFHNDGHVPRGSRALMAHYDMFDIEALPTGGWGYDYYPLAARYLEAAGMPFAGMTARFHSHWGEFNGYKLPDALRYEAGVALAHGGAFTIGDMLMADGSIDPTSVELVAPAFADAARAEPWCVGSTAVSEIALLSSFSWNRTPTPWSDRDCVEDNGALRLLSDLHHQFAVIDADMDFAPYRLLVLPDRIGCTEALAAKLRAYVEGGGRILATGWSGLLPDGRFALDCGAEPAGDETIRPVFVDLSDGLGPDWLKTPLVAYAPGIRLRPGGGEQLGTVLHPQFERSARHFCGHLHFPPHPPSRAEGLLFGTRNGPLVQIGPALFQGYAEDGAGLWRDVAGALIDQLLDGDPLVRTSLPLPGRLLVRAQSDPDRWIVHLLYAPRVTRGAFRGRAIEVIDELPTLQGIDVDIRTDRRVTAVRSVPDGTPLPFRTEGNRLHVRVPELRGHGMVELAFG